MSQDPAKNQCLRLWIFHTRLCKIHALGCFTWPTCQDFVQPPCLRILFDIHLSESLRAVSRDPCFRTFYKIHVSGPSTRSRLLDPAWKSCTEWFKSDTTSQWVQFETHESRWPGGTVASIHCFDGNTKHVNGNVRGQTRKTFVIIKVVGMRTKVSLMKILCRAKCGTQRLDGPHVSGAPT